MEGAILLFSWVCSWPDHLPAQLNDYDLTLSPFSLFLSVLLFFHPPPITPLLLLSYFFFSRSCYIFYLLTHTDKHSTVLPSSFFCHNDKVTLFLLISLLLISPHPLISHDTMQLWKTKNSLTFSLTLGGKVNMGRSLCRTSPLLVYRSLPLLGFRSVVGLTKASPFDPLLNWLFILTVAFLFLTVTSDDECTTLLSLSLTSEL